MNFKKINNLSGWIVFAISLAVYALSREAKGSLWDCGEFVACAFKLGMPHPPGAPLFTLLGRFFIILFGDNPDTAASAVNFMSATASAGTIIFLFWSITHFGRKLMTNNKIFEITIPQTVTVMIAGAVGALAYAFTDSFWYSAVEGEVYALSSFFTALVFWAIIKWEVADYAAGNDEAEKLKADKWIVFLFFMMGLSIGVHLLNLLTIPAIVMLYYFKRYTPTKKGTFWAFIIGCLITGIVQVAVIQYSMKAAGLFDVFFVNNFSLPFFSGFTIYFILIALIILVGINFTNKVAKSKIIIWTSIFFALAFLPFAFSSESGAPIKIILLLAVGAGLGYLIKPSSLKIMKLFLWCFAFMMVGYFMYLMTMIRSNADPAIDMNNVDNPISLVYYLGREQYGSAPLIYGPHFAAQVEADDNGNYYKKGEVKYAKSHGKYIVTGTALEPNYRKEDYRLFPRIWDSSNDQNHASFYADWLGIAPVTEHPNDGRDYEAPTFAQNVNWFITYQTSFMYMRYFMWNFAGRQNDVQGYGNVRDGNWITGISIIDNALLGDQSKLPDSIKDNKAHNTYFLLPLFLGILGFVFQFMFNKRDFIVTFLLFFFTGLAVVLYLNQPGYQPRERDYAYVGSFYAFAIWIGLAVVAFVKLANEGFFKKEIKNILTFGAAITLLTMISSSLYHSGGSGFIISAITATILFVVFVLIVAFILKTASNKGTNLKMANIVVGAVCLAVPALMLSQTWNDHDRSGKTVAPDVAKDFLESCAPNAILFTFGDNDTYPLWYAQEVEGIRTDIRIINTSLLGIDWYINQLRYKINNANAVDVIFTPEQIEGNNRNYIRIGDIPGNTIDKDEFYDLEKVMREYLGQKVAGDSGGDEGPSVMPFKRFVVPVDKANLGTGFAKDSVLSHLPFEIPVGAIAKNDLVVLSIIAANHWKRPIYFTMPYGSLGFGQYLRKDGLSYRLVPLELGEQNSVWETDKLLRQIGAGTTIRNNNLADMGKNIDKFAYGGINKPGVYLDEENRRQMLIVRGTLAEAAGKYADNGNKEEAAKILEKAQTNMLASNLPIAMVSRSSNHNQNALLYLEAFYKAGKLDQARKIAEAIRKDITQQKAYYDYIATSRPERQNLGYEAKINEAMGYILDEVEAKYDPLKKRKETPLQEIAPGDEIEQKAAADTAKK